MLHLPTFPPHMKQAGDTQKGQNWFIELLIFFLVYLVSSTAMSFILIAGAVITVLKDSSIMQQFATGDMQQAETLMNNLLESDSLMLFMLYANAAIIFLTILFCITIRNARQHPWDLCAERQDCTIWRAQVWGCSSSALQFLSICSQGP